MSHVPLLSKAQWVGLQNRDLSLVATRILDTLPMKVHHSVLIGNISRNRNNRIFSLRHTIETHDAEFWCNGYIMVNISAIGNFLYKQKDLLRLLWELLIVER